MKSRRGCLLARAPVLCCALPDDPDSRGARTGDPGARCARPVWAGARKGARNPTLCEIASAVVLLIIVMAEGLCHAAGLNAEGGLAAAMPDRFRESGITKGWRAEVSTNETIIVLLLVILARIVGTLVEEKFASNRFGPRRNVVKRLLEMCLRDGPRPFRVFCLMFVLGQLLIMPSEVLRIDAPLPSLPPPLTRERLPDGLLRKVPLHSGEDC